MSKEENGTEELSISNKFRREQALKYAIRGVKYVMSYLRDYPIEFIPDCQGDPIEVRLRIWWKEEDYQERLMPAFAKPMLDRMEKNVSRIAQSIGDTQISKPVHDDRAR
jgi:hypothetical protein